MDRSLEFKDAKFCKRTHPGSWWYVITKDSNEALDFLKQAYGSQKRIPKVISFPYFNVKEEPNDCFSLISFEPSGYISASEIEVHDYMDSLIFPDSYKEYVARHKEDC